MCFAIPTSSGICHYLLSSTCSDFYVFHQWISIALYALKTSVTLFTFSTLSGLALLTIWPEQKSMYYAWLHIALVAVLDLSRRSTLLLQTIEMMRINGQGSTLSPWIPSPLTPLILLPPFLSTATRAGISDKYKQLCAGTNVQQRRDFRFIMF